MCESKKSALYENEGMGKKNLSNISDEGAYEYVSAQHNEFEDNGYLTPLKTAGYIYVDHPRRDQSPRSKPEKIYDLDRSTDAEIVPNPVKNLDKYNVNKIKEVSCSRIMILMLFILILMIVLFSCLSYIAYEKLTSSTQLDLPRLNNRTSSPDILPLVPHGYIAINVRCYKDDVKVQTFENDEDLPHQCAKKCDQTVGCNMISACKYSEYCYLKSKCTVAKTEGCWTTYINGFDLTVNLGCNNISSIKTCYYLTSKAGTYQEMNLYCENKHSDMIGLEIEEEIKWIQQRLRIKGVKKNIFLLENSYFSQLKIFRDKIKFNKGMADYLNNQNNNSSIEYCPNLWLTESLDTSDYHKIYDFPCIWPSHTICKFTEIEQN